MSFAAKSIVTIATALPLLVGTAPSGQAYTCPLPAPPAAPRCGNPEFQSCRIDVPECLPAASMDPAVRHHLYLATKEILHNVAKHADAKEIHFALKLEPASFRMIIEDDGCGFDHAEEAKLEADGLGNLQARLQQLGGACARRSAPGQGTAVELQVPLAALG